MNDYPGYRPLAEIAYILSDDPTTGPEVIGARQSYVPPPKSVFDRAGAIRDLDERPLPPLNIVAASAFSQIEPRPRAWHVHGLVPAREITLMSGDGGTGKSLLALQLAVATAAGIDWIGHYPEHGRVLFVSAEDDIDELHRRLANIAHLQAVDIAALDNLEFIPLAGRDAVLAAPTTRDGPLKETPLFTAIRSEVERRRPALLILDTLADLFAGNEIVRHHARQFVGMLRGLAIDFDATILLLSHPSQSGMASGAGTSGSTAWNNSVRSRLYLERPRGSEDDDEDTDLRILSTKKANYGRAGGEIVLRWKDGVFVLNGAMRAETLEFNAADERAFLTCLEEFNRSGRDVSANRGRTFAPSLFAASQAAQGLSKARLEAAMNRLFSSNRIHNRIDGPPSKQRRRIAEGPAPTREDVQ